MITRFILYISILFTLSLLPFLNLKAQLVLSEVCSKNNTILFDFEGDAEDWIELKNGGVGSINLNSFYLSDDSSTLKKWQLPDLILSSDSFFVVFASGKNLNLSNEFHSNFKISSKGEMIYLYDTLTNSIDSLSVPTLQNDHSYAISDNSYFYFDTPTPFADNLGPIFLGYANAAQINLPSGFYSYPLNLYISNFDSSTQYAYTLNGNYPLQSDSSISAINEIIAIDSTRVLSLRSFKENYLPSEIVNYSYFINEQTDYPVFSIVFPPAYFFGDNGLYVYGDSLSGNNIYQDIRKKVYVDYFDEEKETYLNDYFEAKLHGGSSLVHAMKSLRITAKSKYGSSKIKNRFFAEERNIDAYNSILLRNAGNDNNRCFFRDAMFQNHLLKNKIENCDFQNDKLALVYLNGRYWGIHHIREKYNESFFADLHDVDKTDINYIEKNNALLYGSDSTWNNMVQFAVAHDLTLDSNYAFINSKVEIMSLIDNFVIETYANNTDWPQNNLKYYNAAGAQPKWKYALYDFDAGLNFWYNSNYDDDRLGAIFNDPFTSVFQENYMDSIAHVKLFKNLLANQKFKVSFINRYCDLLNTVFQPETLLNSVDSYKSDLDLEMDRHMQRWNNPGLGEHIWWDWHIDALKTFFINRNSFARSYLQNHLNLEDSINLKLSHTNSDTIHYTINSLSLSENNWSGWYFKNIPVEIRLDSSFLQVLDSALIFNYWRLILNGNDTIEIDSTAFTYTFQTSAEIFPVFESMSNDTLNNDTIYTDTLAINTLEIDSSVLTLNNFDVQLYTYPNPVNDLLYFNFDVERIEKIEIYALNGQKVIECKNGIEKMIYVGDLNTGTYFFQLLLKNNEKIIEKFIKHSN